MVTKRYLVPLVIALILLGVGGVWFVIRQQSNADVPLATPVANDAFELAVYPKQLHLDANASVRHLIALHGKAGFNDRVVVTVSGLPADIPLGYQEGVRAGYYCVTDCTALERLDGSVPFTAMVGENEWTSFSPLIIPSTNPTAGTYTVTVTASASGYPAISDTFALIVDDDPSSLATVTYPEFVGGEQEEYTARLDPGQRAQFRIGYDGYHTIPAFTGNVEFVSSQGSGVAYHPSLTTSFSPSRIAMEDGTGGLAAFTVQTAADTPPGLYTMLVGTKHPQDGSVYPTLAITLEVNGRQTAGFPPNSSEVTTSPTEITSPAVSPISSPSLDSGEITPSPTATSESNEEDNKPATVSPSVLPSSPKDSGEPIKTLAPTVAPSASETASPTVPKNGDASSQPTLTPSSPSNSPVPTGISTDSKAEQQAPASSPKPTIPPALALSATSVKPGDEVIVELTNFSPGAKAALLWDASLKSELNQYGFQDIHDGEVLKELVINGSGTASTTFIVPWDSAGDHWLMANSDFLGGQETGLRIERAQQTLRLTEAPVLKLSTGNGFAGSQLGIRGEYFAPNEKLYLFWDPYTTQIKTTGPDGQVSYREGQSGRYRIGEGIADATGTLEFTATVPEFTWAGKHDLRLTNGHVGIKDNEHSAMAKFEVVLADTEAAENGVYHFVDTVLKASGSAVSTERTADVQRQTVALIATAQSERFNQYQPAQVVPEAPGVARVTENVGLSFAGGQCPVTISMTQPNLVERALTFLTQTSAAQAQTACDNSVTVAHNDTNGLVQQYKSEIVSDYIKVTSTPPVLTQEQFLQIWQARISDLSLDELVELRKTVQFQIRDSQSTDNPLATDLLSFIEATEQKIKGARTQHTSNLVLRHQVKAVKSVQIFDASGQKVNTQKLANYPVEVGMKVRLTMDDGKVFEYVVTAESPARLEVLHLYLQYQQAHTGKDKLRAWLEDPAAKSEVARYQLSKAQELIGSIMSYDQYERRYHPLRKESENSRVATYAYLQDGTWDKCISYSPNPRLDQPPVCSASIVQKFLVAYNNLQNNYSVGPYTAYEAITGKTPSGESVTRTDSMAGIQGVAFTHEEIAAIHAEVWSGYQGYLARENARVIAELRDEYGIVAQVDSAQGVPVFDPNSLGNLTNASDETLANILAVINPTTIRGLPENAITFSREPSALSMFFGSAQAAEEDDVQTVRTNYIQLKAKTGTLGLAILDPGGRMSGWHPLTHQVVLQNEDAVFFSPGEADSSMYVPGLLDGTYQILLTNLGDTESYAVELTIALGNRLVTRSLTGTMKTGESTAEDFVITINDSEVPLTPEIAAGVYRDTGTSDAAKSGLPQPWRYAVVTGILFAVILVTGRILYRQSSRYHRKRTRGAKHLGKKTTSK